MGMVFKFQMGMKSLKWEGIGTKNLFPHTSICGLSVNNYLLLVPVNVASLYVVHVNGFIIVVIITVTIITILWSLMMCSFNTNCTKMNTSCLL